jgi:hypothetical protein
MENATDDPREFHRQGGPDLGGDDIPIGLETFLRPLIFILWRPIHLTPNISRAVRHGC